ncbi:MAG: hypothetical protein ACREA9_24795 [Pyrinomonadaceae bacterium]
MKEQSTKHAILNWEAIGACFCFAGGIGAALVGSILTASSWILGVQLHPWLHWLATALLIVTIPLLIFSGYCLDWMEREPKRAGTTEFQNVSQH